MRAAAAVRSPGLQKVVVVTTDTSVLPEAEQFIVPCFHTTLLPSLDHVTGSEEAFDAIVADIDQEGSPEEGLAKLSGLRNKNSDLMLVALTRSDDTQLRKKAARKGIDEFFVAPVDFRTLQIVLERGLEKRSAMREGDEGEGEFHGRYSFYELIGGSEPMLRVYEAIKRVADSTTTVMIRGESGTGKELVAKSIVAAGPRASKPFISVNCAALPDSLIEAELFGYERGAFTGAVNSKPGHFELAHGGTIFLDEIGTLGLELQSKLLRVLEEHTVQRLGGKQPKKIDFRLITATNEPLEEMVETGRFRQDLYYRIQVIPIHMPPLRERGGDIAVLAEHFLRTYCAANKLPMKRFDLEALDILEENPWPGNVRELENLVQRLVLMVDGDLIGPQHLPRQILSQSAAQNEALLIPDEGIDFDREMERIEQAYLRAALRRAGGRKVTAASLLKVNGQRMKYLCRKYGIANHDSG
jgi:DNA-binding NtrC family response regulator